MYNNTKIRKTNIYFEKFDGRTENKSLVLLGDCFTVNWIIFCVTLSCEYIKIDRPRTFLE